MAQKYRKIDPRIWTDEKFSQLDPLDKLIVLNVFTGQANRCGIFSFSIPLAAEQCGVQPDTYAIRFLKLVDTFGWRWDKGTKVLYLPTWWKYNEPQNPKHLIGCLEDLHDLPQTVLLQDFAENTQYLSDTYAYTYRIRMGKPIPKGMAKQEQEQEQNIKKERGSGEDELDTQVRDFFNKSPLVVYSPKAHGEMRRLVQSAGWANAEKFVQQGAASGASFPISYALTLAAKAEQKKAAGDDHKKTPRERDREAFDKAIDEMELPA